MLASSLKFHSPNVLRVCLLSPDLDSPRIKEDLEALYDHVIVVDLIYAEARNDKWLRYKFLLCVHVFMFNRFQEMYESWSNYCFTKLQCLKLEEHIPGLQKILFMDADTLVLG